MGLMDKEPIETKDEAADVLRPEFRLPSRVTEAGGLASQDVSQSVWRMVSQAAQDLSKAMRQGQVLNSEVGLLRMEMIVSRLEIMTMMLATMDASNRDRLMPGPEMSALLTHHEQQNRLTAVALEKMTRTNGTAEILPGPSPAVPPPSPTGDNAVAPVRSAPPRPVQPTPPPNIARAVRPTTSATPPKFSAVEASRLVPGKPVLMKPKPGAPPRASSAPQPAPAASAPKIAPKAAPTPAAAPASFPKAASAPATAGGQPAPQSARPQPMASKPAAPNLAAKAAPAATMAPAPTAAPAPSGKTNIADAKPAPTTSPAPAASAPPVPAAIAPTEAPMPAPTPEAPRKPASALDSLKRLARVVTGKNQPPSPA